MVPKYSTPTILMTLSLASVKGTALFFFFKFQKRYLRRTHPRTTRRMLITAAIGMESVQNWITILQATISNGTRNAWKMKKLRPTAASKASST